MLSSYIGSGVVFRSLDLVARRTFTHWARPTFIFLMHDLENIEFKKLLVLFLQFMRFYIVKLLSTVLAADIFELSNLKTRISVYTVLKSWKKQGLISLCLQIQYSNLCYSTGQRTKVACLFYTYRCLWEVDEYGGK